MISSKLDHMGSRRAAAWFVSGLLLTTLVAVAMAAPGCANGTSADAKAKSAKALDREDDRTFTAGASRRPSAKTTCSMAKILIAKGRDRDAINLLGQTIQQYPTYLPAYNEMAGIYLRSDRPNDAIQVLSSGLKRSPDDAVLQNNLGMCWFLKEDYERALAAFHSAASAVPNNATYRANEAAALGMLGADREAAQAYDGAVSDSAVEHNLAVLRKARTQKAAAAAADDPTQQRELQDQPLADDGPQARLVQRGTGERD